MNIKVESTKEIAEALHDDDLLKSVGGLSAEQIRKNVEKVGIIIPEGKSDKEIIESVKSAIKKVKDLDSDRLQNLVYNFINNGKINL